MAGPRDVLVFREPAPPAPALALADSFLRQGAPNTNEGAKEFAQLGGLVSYGASVRWLNVRAADFVAKILRGAKPAELPVEHPTRFELVINLKTAKALGLTIPPTVLARADEIIE